MTKFCVKQGSRIFGIYAPDILCAITPEPSSRKCKVYVTNEITPQDIQVNSCWSHDWNYVNAIIFICQIFFSDNEKKLVSIWVIQCVAWVHFLVGPFLLHILVNHWSKKGKNSWDVYFVANNWLKPSKMYFFEVRPINIRIFSIYSRQQCCAGSDEVWWPFSPIFMIKSQAIKTKLLFLGSLFHGTSREFPMAYPYVHE